MDLRWHLPPIARFFIVFVAALVVGGGIVAINEQRRVETNRQVALNKALDHGAQIKSRLDFGLSATYTLAALVKEREGDTKHFASIARGILPSYPGVSALQLAPKGVVRQVVPMEGNEKVIGHDLLADPRRNMEAFVAVATKQMTLAGPFDLLQGGRAVIGRLPVFLPGPSGEEIFWGFATALIRTGDLVVGTRLMELGDDKYRFRLVRIYLDRPEEVLAATADLPRDPVAYRFSVHNALWELRLEPAKGWHAWPEIALELTLVLMLAALLGFIAYRAAQEPSRLLGLVKQRSAELHQQATRDVLTGLPNRALLHDRIATAIANAARSGTQVAVMVLDLDRLKHVNDSLGLRAGDELIRTMAERLEGAVRDGSPVEKHGGHEPRTGDTVARFGGDEFALVLGDVSSAERLAAAARRILTAVSRPAAIQGHELHVTCTLGIAIYPKDGDDSNTLLTNAHAALDIAKDGGKNDFRFFTEELNARALERMAIETQLRRALADSALRLHYQPQIDLGTGALLGVEALLRWQHPQLGLVTPGRFISIAEESGIIVPMGDWVLREACRQCKAWQQAGLETGVAVNVSALQFRQKGFVASVAGILAETGLRPESLELEITEGVVMRDVEWVIGELHSLKRLGVRLSIDDFGTGYSSLAYLRRLPVDRLKIDMSFVREILTSPDAAAIAGLVIDIGHTLGMRVIAEGVEAPEQAEFLAGRGCDEAQGYYYSKPLTPEAFADRYGARRQLRPAAVLDVETV